jgi:hypothetical protein
VRLVDLFDHPYVVRFGGLLVAQQRFNLLPELREEGAC